MPFAQKSDRLTRMLAILLGLLVVGCATLPAASEPWQVARAEVEPGPAPDVPASDLTELVTGNSAFAFDLYQAVREAPGNLFYSPYSISSALAMTYAGARSATEEQMAGTLLFVGRVFDPA